MARKFRIKDYSTLTFALLFISFFIIFAIRPSVGLIMSLFQEQREYATINTQLDLRIQEIIAAQNTYAQIVEHVDTINATLPDKYVLTDTKTILDASSSAPLVAATVQKSTLKPLPVSILTPLSINVTLEGTWESVREYILSVRKQPRLYLVDALAFDRAEGTISALLDASIQLKTFFYKSP